MSMLDKDISKHFSYLQEQNCMCVSRIFLQTSKIARDLYLCVCVS